VPVHSAEPVIRLLALQPHPEGGHYAELFRSPLAVTSAAHPSVRAASTAIYFLLKEGEFSALHRVRSDEVWHHYAGDAIELHAFDEAKHTLCRLGGDLVGGERPMAVIPAGVWQAARIADVAGPRHGYGLCGCTVAPGFDFVDFELPSREEMLAKLAAHGEWVRALTRP
jgi:predicted cupin superfamily sugar epimerase